MPTTNERRCDQCGRPGFGNRFRETRSSPLYQTAVWRRLRARVIAAWVAGHGWTCPGWHRDQHAVPRDGLALDHVEPLSRGGAPLDEANLSPLCPSCNGRKSLSQRAHGRRPA